MIKKLSVCVLERNGCAACICLESQSLGVMSGSLQSCVLEDTPTPTFLFVFSHYENALAPGRSCHVADVFVVLVACRTYLLLPLCVGGHGTLRESCAHSLTHDVFD